VRRSANASAMVLVALKKKWDPDNLLRRNHNIDPTG
jgi:hypothetical protein